MKWPHCCLRGAVGCCILLVRLVRWSLLDIYIHILNRPIGLNIQISNKNNNRVKSNSGHVPGRLTTKRLGDYPINIITYFREVHLASESRPALRPTQPPVQWVPGNPFNGAKRGRGVTLTTHPHLVPRSRLSRSNISSPPKRHHGV
jgi:hypothetical protein